MYANSYPSNPSVEKRLRRIDPLSDVTQLHAGNAALFLLHEKRRINKRNRSGALSECPGCWLGDARCLQQHKRHTRPARLASLHARGWQAAMQACRGVFSLDSGVYCGWGQTGTLLNQNALVIVIEIRSPSLLCWYAEENTRLTRDDTSAFYRQSRAQTQLSSVSSYEGDESSIPSPSSNTALRREGSAATLLWEEKSEKPSISFESAYAFLDAKLVCTATCMTTTLHVYCRLCECVKGNNVGAIYDAGGYFMRYREQCWQQASCKLAWELGSIFHEWALPVLHRKRIKKKKRHEVPSLSS